MKAPLNRKERIDLIPWLARLAVGSVLAMNASCALSFILHPGWYAAGFELSGVPGEAVVRGFGILFLMWNVPYVPVAIHPARQRALFIVILVQQAIGVLGEGWMWLVLPPGHLILQETGLRFILFDGLGLIGMAAAFWILSATKK